MAKTNHSHKSSHKKQEAPPSVLQSSVSPAPVKQAAPVKQEVAPKQEVAAKQEAAVQQAAPVRTGPTDEQISYRAYEIFIARGGEHGHHDQDWQQAERELRLGR